MKRIMLFSVGAIALGLALSTIWYNYFLNRYQVDGQLELATLEQPVTVHRDQYGIPYIHAQNYADLLRAQGFITAQDRMMHLELFRRVVAGRMAELVGESALDSDIRVRVAGYYQAAKRHLPLLSEDARSFLQWYVEGINAFIENRQDEYPLELKILGVSEAEPWTVTDALSILYFGSSIHGTNLKGELLSQSIRDELGEDALRALFPTNSNPDRNGSPLKTGYDHIQSLSMTFEGMSPFAEGAPPLFGSNNWVLSPQKSASGHAMVTNDPHLDGSQLPGMMYPVGLFAPGIRSIGLTMAGIPGLLIGRTDHIAFGVTNAYGDSQDTYITQEDPNRPEHYLQDGHSLPFKIHRETIQIKSDKGFRKHSLEIRSTTRGPVISDHEVFGIHGDKIISARWAANNHHRSEIGINRFLTAENAQQFEEAIHDIDLLYFNFVFADREGNIGQRASGLVPTRVHGGATPTLASNEDNWNGYIPKQEMPGGKNPARGWLGTANHDTRGDDYPYYYTSHFAPNYRYVRMVEVLDSTDKLSAQQSWELMRDNRNTLAVNLAPLMADWLRGDPRTKPLAELLDDWDYFDNSDSVGATVFHTVYEIMAPMIFEDEMSPRLHKEFMTHRYYWQQRLDNALLSGSSQWFDDRRTAEVESIKDIALQAGEKALAQLQKTLGTKSENWTWGKASTMVFVSPLRKKGLGRDFLGGGEHPGRGSNETLNRGAYATDSFPFNTKYIAVARIVADFSDDEKIMAVIPAGNVARQGHPWMMSQLSTYLEGKWIPWWRDETRIVEHAQHTLMLLPSM